MYFEEVKESRQTKNPWERVIANVEVNSSQYVGQKDVSRMKQAMLARKGDITKSGGLPKGGTM